MWRTLRSLFGRKRERYIPEYENDPNYTRPEDQEHDTIVINSYYCEDADNPHNLPECDGLWEEELEELTIGHYNVSLELQARFREWRRTMLERRKHPPAPRMADNNEWLSELTAWRDKVDNEAIELGRALARELPDRTVYYQLYDNSVKIFQGEHEWEIP